MWRLVPLLAMLGCLEVLVPWPDVAALVLSQPSRTELHAQASPATGSATEAQGERLQLLVQSPTASP
jgi:hypothetical protein